MPTPYKPVISVIVPTKNRPHLLKRALLSVAIQNYPSFEVCVVDNNIDEEIIALAKCTVAEFKESYPLIKWLYIYSEKPFASGARNDGIAATSGQFIVFLDDDDELLPGSIKVRADEMLADPTIALLYCGGYSSIYPYPFKMYRYYHYSPVLHKDDLLMMSCSSNIINRQLFENHNLVFDESLSRMEDYDLNRKIIGLNLKVKSIPQALVHIHLHPETRMSSQKITDDSFKSILISRWGATANDMIYNYSEGVHIWRKCFNLEEDDYEAIKASLKKDFNRLPTRSFRYKYWLVSFSPVIFLTLYHIAVSVSQFYKNLTAKMNFFHT
jgi:glycosyltransferase involved in cell wall biosynthesis